MTTQTSTHLPTLSTRKGKLVVRNTEMTLAELRSSYTLAYGYNVTTVGDLPSSILEPVTRPASVIRRARREASYAVAGSPAADQAFEMAVWDAINQRAYARFISRKLAQEAKS